MRNDAIDKLLDATSSLWQGRRPNRAQRTLPTGYACLDERLPCNGWPVGAAIEIIADRSGVGELSLLLPALAELGAQGQWVVMVNPPWIPYPPALHARGVALERLLLVRTDDRRAALWACEQALRNGRGGALLAWPQGIGFPQLRRLQLAAREQDKLAFLFRSGPALRETSPAALRLCLERGANGAARLRFVKCRGSHPPAPLDLRLAAVQPGIRLPHRDPAHAAVPAGRRGAQTRRGVPSECREPS